MEDSQILALYFARSENAISQTALKYGNYCFHIAYQILANREDAEESVNDTYMEAWNGIPPSRPPVLSAYLGKIVRNISIDRWRAGNAEKRGGGEFPLCLEELANCVSGKADIAQEEMMRETVAALNRFLRNQPKTDRKVFLRRYWYLDSVSEIAETFGFSRTKVTTMLYRTRKKLRRQLEREGLL